MFYILFKSKESLEKFLSDELVSVDCPSRCSRACFEEREIYRLRRLNDSIEVMIRIIGDNILLIFPCDAYDGMGFIVGSRVAELISRHYTELVNYVVNVVKMYDIDFLSITSLPLELDVEYSIYSYSCDEFLNLVYAFYIKNTDISYLYNVTSRSRFASTLIYTLCIYVLREASIVLNPYVPLNMMLLIHLLLANIKRICEKVFERISSESDLLCLLCINN